MKNKMSIGIAAVVALNLAIAGANAQSFDEERMTKDLKVAENVLATLIKHEMSNERMLFGLDIRGSYQPGYGVTFRLPPDQSIPVMTISGTGLRHATVISDGNGFRYSVRTDEEDQSEAERNAIRLKDRAQISADSVRAAYNESMIKVAQDFILDYGDLISQLGPAEKIVVTNQMDRPYFYISGGNRTRISVEGSRQDVTAFRLGKLSREQAVKRLTVVNTETVDTREPDMETLATIFSRLYRPDLSQTYFVEGNVYYERLKDFGAVFYLQMVSSVGKGLDRFAMPTQGLDNLDQESRDKKVVELYPVFEEDLKQNILEYGRTVKSLAADEHLIFNVSLTKCPGCGIPATLELAVPGAVLKDLSAGKIDKTAAMKKLSIKKGAPQ